MKLTKVTLLIVLIIILTVVFSIFYFKERKISPKVPTLSISTTTKVLPNDRRISTTTQVSSSEAIINTTTQIFSNKEKIEKSEKEIEEEINREKEIEKNIKDALDSWIKYKNKGRVNILMGCQKEEFKFKECRKLLEDGSYLKQIYVKISDDLPFYIFNVKLSPDIVNYTVYITREDNPNKIIQKIEGSEKFSLWSIENLDIFRDAIIEYLLITKRDIKEFPSSTKDFISLVVSSILDACPLTLSIFIEDINNDGYNDLIPQWCQMHGRGGFIILFNPLKLIFDFNNLIEVELPYSTFEKEGKLYLKTELYYLGCAGLCRGQELYEFNKEGYYFEKVKYLKIEYVALFAEKKKPEDLIEVRKYYFKEDFTKNNGLSEVAYEGIDDEGNFAGEDKIKPEWIERKIIKKVKNWNEVMSLDEEAVVSRINDSSKLGKVEKSFSSSYVVDLKPNEEVLLGTSKNIKLKLIEYKESNKIDFLDDTIIEAGSDYKVLYFHLKVHRLSSENINRLFNPFIDIGGFACNKNFTYCYSLNISKIKPEKENIIEENERDFYVAGLVPKNEKLDYVIFYYNYTPTINENIQEGADIEGGIWVNTGGGDFRNYFAKFNFE